MIKRKDTKLIVENWRRFINEADDSLSEDEYKSSIKVNDVKISQVLFDQDAAKAFIEKYGNEGSGARGDMNSLSSVKSSKKIFNITKPILNMLIIGPLTVTFNETLHERGENKWILLLFRDHQGASKEYEYPRKLANSIRNRGFFDSELYQMLYSNSSKMQNVDIITTVEESSPLSYFCKRMLKGEDPAFEGSKNMGVMKGDAGIPTAHSGGGGKSLSNATAYHISLQK